MKAKVFALCLQGAASDVQQPWRVTRHSAWESRHRHTDDKFWVSLKINVYKRTVTAFILLKIVMVCKMFRILWLSHKLDLFICFLQWWKQPPPRDSHWDNGSSHPICEDERNAGEFRAIKPTNVAVCFICLYCYYNTVNNSFRFRSLFCEIIATVTLIFHVKYCLEFYKKCRIETYFELTPTIVVCVSNVSVCQ